MCSGNLLPDFLVCILSAFSKQRVKNDRFCLSDLNVWESISLISDQDWKSQDRKLPLPFEIRTAPSISLRIAHCKKYPPKSWRSLWRLEKNKKERKHGKPAAKLPFLYMMPEHLDLAAEKFCCLTTFRLLQASKYDGSLNKWGCRRESIKSLCRNCASKTMSSEADSVIRPASKTKVKT